MKLKTLLSGLRKAQQALSLIEDSGIDVDRLIAIANAQGPQDKILETPVNNQAGTKNKSPRRKTLKS